MTVGTDGDVKEGEVEHGTRARWLAAVALTVMAIAGAWLWTTQGGETPAGEPRTIPTVSGDSPEQVLGCGLSVMFDAQVFKAATAEGAIGALIAASNGAGFTVTAKEWLGPPVEPAADRSFLLFHDGKGYATAWAAPADGQWTVGLARGCLTG